MLVVNNLLTLHTTVNPIRVYTLHALGTRQSERQQALLHLLGHDCTHRRHDTLFGDIPVGSLRAGSQEHFWTRKLIFEKEKSGSKSIVYYPIIVARVINILLGDI